MKNSLNEIERTQSQIRAIEARDRSVMEHNFTLVNWLGLLNLGCLLFAAIVQVLICFYNIHNNAVLSLYTLFNQTSKKTSKNLTIF